MSRFAERARGVILQVPDLSELIGQALSYRQKTHPDCYEAKIYGGKYALGKAHTGHLWAICTEGVGYVVSKEEPMEFQFHGSYYMREESLEDDLLGRNVPGPIKKGSHTFDVMPFGSVTLSVDDLKGYPILEEVDLADHVRSFGNRLEDNFWGMHEALTYNEFAASRRF